MISTRNAAPGRLRLAATLLLGTMLATAAPLAAHAETLTVTDVAVPAGPFYTLTIPSVEVTDGNLTEAQVRDLFQIDSVDDLSKWAAISAASLKVPEITMTYSVPPATGGTPVSETVTYRDIELTDVKDGVAASTLVGGAEILAPEGISMTFGKMSSGRFDIGALLSFYGIGGPGAAPDMKEVYADFAFDGGSFRVGTKDVTVLQCDFGGATAGRFLARPLKTSLADLQGAILRLQDAQKANPSATPGPDDVKLFVAYYADLLTAFSTDPMQMEGFNCSGNDPQTLKSFKTASGAIKIGGFEPGIYPDISLDNFSIDAGADSGFIKLGNFTWKRMDLNGPIEALEHAAQLDEAWFTANWRKLIPAMDGMKVSDVSFDFPDPSVPAQRTKGVAGLFDVTLGKYVNGLPSQIALALDDATFPLPAELATGPAAAELQARNITEVTSDTHVKLHWDEPSQTIVVDELLSDADNFFRINVTGTVGNATSALFSANDAEALAASQALTVKDLKLDLEDRGFYGMVLAISSAQGNQPLQATRTAISGMVQGMTLAILGSDQTALAAAGEMGKFLSGNNSKLSITLTAKDGVGLSLADLAALEKDPTVLAGKVDITAVASGDPVPQPEATPVPAPADANPVAPDANPATPDANPAAPADANPASPAAAGASLQDQKRGLKAPAQQ